MIKKELLFTLKILFVTLLIIIEINIIIFYKKEEKVYFMEDGIYYNDVDGNFAYIKNDIILLEYDYKTNTNIKRKLLGYYINTNIYIDNYIYIRYKTNYFFIKNKELKEKVFYKKIKNF